MPRMSACNTHRGSATVLTGSEGQSQQFTFLTGFEARVASSFLPESTMCRAEQKGATILQPFANFNKKQKQNDVKAFVGNCG